MMTWRDYMTLCAIDNPFVVNSGPPAIADILAFLWQVSEMNTPSVSRWRKKLKMRAFAKSLRKMRFGEVVDAIEDYVETTFIDPPSSSGERSKPFASFMALHVDSLASEYGWTCDEIMTQPIRRLQQLYRAAQRRNKPDAIMFNSISDSVTQRILDELNKPK
jgi:hypothetical protein